ncbi:hypothetical protein Vadar_026306 [Vaccinium darrowii]|uniref:Uncharacterized protein n=1 Tax=Vaccinium darrowii TaxID=229202 RepID=A0ACB7ZDU7_9ERIC|nr:hypothetical protein Vadar_026306 [Vaccinium darrowii]
MTRQIVLESPAQVNRMQPLLGEKKTSASGKEERRRVGEVAGGTAAECAAVCCCCPCAVMDLLLLAVYKVPTGLCKKAWKKKQRQMMKKKKAALLQQQQQQTTASTSSSSLSKAGTGSSFNDSEIGKSDADERKGEGSTVDFETEMWDRFYGAGFWRSTSQREGERAQAERLGLVEALRRRQGGAFMSTYPQVEPSDEALRRRQGRAFVSAHPQAKSSPLGRAFSGSP